MNQDRYALKLERAIFNWFYGGDNASPEAVFNAVANGLMHNMQVIVPIETPKGILKMIGDPEKIKEGDILSLGEDISIGFRRLMADRDGGYFIPLFTSPKEMEKGGVSSSVNQSLKALFEAANTWQECIGFIINPYGQKLVLQKPFIQMLLSYKPRSHFFFVKGSVVDMHTDAIVNAANKSLLGGGGVDGAIHRAAGPGLLEECRRLYGCNTGEAKITGAHNINHADCIIHTVGPVYSGKAEDAELLAACYTNSLDLALANGCSSIAFPGISTGVYGYPINQAAKVSLLAVVRWLDAHQDTVMDVYFCCFRDSEMDAYRALTK